MVVLIKGEYTKREVHNVSNAVIIEMENTKSSVRHHGPPINAKIGSGVMEGQIIFKSYH
jgi:hypothetical protein